MCAGLIADRTLLRNGLLAVLGEFALGDAGSFVTLLSRLGSRTHFGAYAKWSSGLSGLSVGLLIDASHHSSTTLSFS